MTKLKDEEILEAYEIFKTITETAKQLGVNQRTISRRLKKLGVKTRPGRRAGVSVPLPHWGCLPEYLKAHPGTVLPRSVKAIMDLTHCSHDAVKTYLWRRREAVRKKARAMDFTTGSFSYEGHVYPWRAAKEVEVWVDPYAFSIHVSGFIPATGKKFSFKFNPEPEAQTEPRG